MSASVKEVLDAMELGLVDRWGTDTQKMLQGALRAAEQAGWVLVPITPDLSMTIRGGQKFGATPLDPDNGCEAACAAYAAMLSAAPSVLEEK